MSKHSRIHISSFLCLYGFLLAQSEVLLAAAGRRSRAAAICCSRTACHGLARCRVPLVLPRLQSCSLALASCPFRPSQEAEATPVIAQLSGTVLMGHMFGDGPLRCCNLLTHRVLLKGWVHSVTYAPRGGCHGLDTLLYLDPRPAHQAMSNTRRYGFLVGSAMPSTSSTPVVVRKARCSACEGRKAGWPQPMSERSLLLHHPLGSGGGIRVQQAMMSTRSSKPIR